MKAWIVALSAVLVCIAYSTDAARVSAVEELKDVKAAKKLFKAKSNLMVLVSVGKVPSSLMSEYEKAAASLKGSATLTKVDCKAARKVCKALKLEGEDEPVLKHYKSGTYTKDYDRALVAKSIVRFMNDPEGDLPYDENPEASAVVHVTDANLDRVLKKGKPTLLFMYAAWCGHCKTFKAPFAEAAAELKGKAILAAINANMPEGAGTGKRFNVTGFPKILYFENGEEKFEYGGERTKDGIIEWLDDPKEPEPPKEEAPDFLPEGDVTMLDDESFDPFMAENPQGVLVFFYAPWCGHCKTAKPEYADAATEMKDEGIERKFAAVDATKAKKLAKKFDVSGFPTIKYFVDGKAKFKYEGGRKKSDFTTFMLDPTAPPPPPAQDPSWADADNEVDHLTDSTFDSFIKKKKAVLVMFYAPWCGHCKSAKPEYDEAALEIAGNRKMSFAAVDATKEKELGSRFEVKGFPAFKFFSYGKLQYDYNGARKKQDFLDFINAPTADTKMPEPVRPPPEGPQWSEEPDAADVMHLTSATYDPFVSGEGKKGFLAMFYAPWCGHCKKMKPAYAEAATKVKNGFVAVDCTQHRDVCEKYSVTGYPTVKFVKGKTAIDYSGERDVDALTSYVRGKLGIKSDL